MLWIYNRGAGPCPAKRVFPSARRASSGIPLIDTSQGRWNNYFGMRTLILTALLGFAVEAQNQQPNCVGIALDVDARCACVKDPKSDACRLVKAGLYEPHDLSKMKTMGGTPAAPATPPARAAAPARAQQQGARVVPLTHKDYLRFLQPNSQMALGIDFGKLAQASPELMAAVFGHADGEDGVTKMMGAMKEMDHLWISLVAPGDVVIVMTGRFEQGVAARMFYSQGIQPVFLGGANAMMIGPEPSIQAALARLAKPAVAGGWVTRRARELAKDHETWIVTEPPGGSKQSSAALSGIRQFAMGVRLAAPAAVDGEVVADSDASAEKIVAWVDHLKAVVREKTGVGALDSLAIERTGATLRFAAKDDTLLSGDAGKKAMSSDLGVELYSVIMGGLPGTPARAVAEDKLLAVKAGMKKEEVLALVGPPLSVSAIQGLDTPRETWTYQIPFGKQLSVRLDGGVVTAPPH